MHVPGCVFSVGTQGHEKESKSYVFLYYVNSTRLGVINVGRLMKAKSKSHIDI